MEAGAAGLLLMLAAYLGVGVVFGLAFAIWGVTRLDPAAQDMPVAARLLIVPGAAALWPLLLWMAWRRRRSPGVS